MTAKADFSETEWASVLEGPPSAGMLVMFAQRGGMFRETFAIAKSYAEARQHHGQSELLDDIVAAKPQMDHSRYHSPEELTTACLAHIREAVSVLDGKATPAEVAEYKQFVVAVAERVAGAHREHGEAVSPAEHAALDQVKEALGT